MSEYLVNMNARDTIMHNKTARMATRQTCDVLFSTQNKHIDDDDHHIEQTSILHLSFPSWHDALDCVHFIGFYNSVLVIFILLFIRIKDNSLFSIDLILRQLMGQHTLHSFAIKWLAYFIDSLRDGRQLYPMKPPYVSTYVNRKRHKKPHQALCLSHRLKEACWETKSLLNAGVSRTKSVHTLAPGRSMRRPTSAPRCAAIITSALRPVTSDSPKTNELATGAMNPSIWTARSLCGSTIRTISGRSSKATLKLSLQVKSEISLWKRITYILMTSPSTRRISASLSSGELWQIQWLTEMHVGNPTPVTNIHHHNLIHRATTILARITLEPTWDKLRTFRYQFSIVIFLVVYGADFFHNLLISKFAKVKGLGASNTLFADCLQNPVARNKNVSGDRSQAVMKCACSYRK